LVDTFCRRPIKMSLLCQSEGVTGRQATVVLAVAVPKDDGVGKRSQDSRIGFVLDLNEARCKLNKPACPEEAELGMSRLLPQRIGLAASG
jgi:hypothetical protein